MKTYLNLSSPEIKGDYEDVIDFLLRNGKRLPYPMANDVTDHWLEPHQKLDFRNVYSLKSYPHSAEIKKIQFWLEEKTESTGKKYILYMPAVVSGEYAAGGGTLSSKDALDWYISTYLKEETAKFDNPDKFINSAQFKEVIESVNISDIAKTPSGKDVHIASHAQMDDDFEKGAVQARFTRSLFYYDEKIIDKDGKPINDKKIHFINDGIRKDGSNSIIVYFPEYLKDEFEKYGKPYIYNGSLLWWFLTEYHNVSAETLNTIKNNSIPIADMKNYLTIPNKPGMH